MSITKYLVVYDPTQEEQPALARMSTIVEDSQAELQVFCCIYKELPANADKGAAIDEQIAAQKEIVETAVKGLREKNVPVAVEIEWGKDWYTAVVSAAKRHNVDGVVKASRKHSTTERRLKRTSDWTLIRECTCPVLLVKGDGNNQENIILAALDNRREQESYRTLNQKTLDMCREFFDNSDTELHYVSAYTALDNRPDRGSLIRACGVESERVHIVMGDAQAVIIETASAIQAGMLVMGSSARSGLSAMLKSNAAEKVLDRVECDLLVIP